jgi:hypothetical protein
MVFNLDAIMCKGSECVCIDRFRFNYSNIWNSIASILIVRLMKTPVRLTNYAVIIKVCIRTMHEVRRISVFN